MVLSLLLACPGRKREFPPYRHRPEDQKDIPAAYSEGARASLAGIVAVKKMMPLSLYLFPDGCHAR